MIKNYFKIAWRNLIKYKMFSLINVFGLSISIASCLLIILLIYGQNKFDDFHKKGDRIVRVLRYTNDDKLPNATTPLPLSKVLLEEYPHIVENAVRIKSSFVGGDVIYNDNRIPLAGRYTDASFFRIFDFKLLNGNAETVLINPFSIVLTEDSAKKLFGNENPIGKSVKINDIGLNTFGIDILNNNKETMLGDFMVTGVVDTSLPSHIQFDFLLSMSTITSLAKQNKAEVAIDNWKNPDESYLYLLLKDSKGKEKLTSVLDQISSKEYAAYKDLNITFSLQPLNKITPGKFVNSPISIRMPIGGIYFLSFLGLVILFSACFNYVNLSLARSLTKTKEIGVRKVIGATRYQVFFQFIIESIMIALISFVIAIIILQVLSLLFLNLWINQFFVLELTPDLTLYLIFLLFSVFVGFLAGILPASFLSKISPVKTIKNSLMTSLGLGKRFTLRKFLVVVQFSVSLFFISTTLLIFLQFNYLLKTDYGFDQDKIINVKLQGLNYETLANEFSQNPDIQIISMSSFLPGTGGYSGQTQVKTTKMSKGDLEVAYIGINQNFIPNLKLKLLVGKNFPKNIPKNNEQLVIINESTAQLLGYKKPEDIVGHTILIGKDEKPLQVIGLLKNFIFDLLMEAEKDEPILLRYLPNEFEYLNVRYQDRSNLSSLLEFMEEKWKKLDHIHSFKYKIYEDELKKSNSAFSDIAYILGFISFLAIIISCLGLLGMTAFTVESKRKEIRIRKIHGAGVKHITIFLTYGFLWLFTIATVLTIPIAYLLNNIWLQEFSYRVDFTIWILILGIGIMFILGLGTTLSQTIRVATSNPLNGLREE